MKNGKKRKREKPCKMEERKNRNEREIKVIIHSVTSWAKINRLLS